MFRSPGDRERAKGVKPAQTLVSPQGSYNQFDFADYGPPTHNIAGFPYFAADMNVITNTAQGAVVSWAVDQQGMNVPHAVSPPVALAHIGAGTGHVEARLPHFRNRRGSPVSLDDDTGVSYFHPDFAGFTTVTGTSVVTTPAPVLTGQTTGLIPVVQQQDGSYVGAWGTGDWSNPQYTMVAFDTTGATRWTVPNEYPKIATADGGAVGQTGAIYSQYGAGIGQTPVAIQSWQGYLYQQLGSLAQIAADPIPYAVSWWAFEGGGQSGHWTAVHSRDAKANDAVKLKILTPTFWQKFYHSNCHQVFSAAAIPSYDNYDAHDARMRRTKEKEYESNFYDVGNPGIADLPLNETTAGQWGSDVKLSVWLANGGANAATANGGYGNQTAIVLAAGLLSRPDIKFILVHELLLHALPGWSDSTIFNNRVLTNNGLWRDSNSTASFTVSTWISTDCRCTPEHIGDRIPLCPANTAKW